MFVLYDFLLAGGYDDLRAEYYTYPKVRYMALEPSPYLTTDYTVFTQMLFLLV